MRVSPRFTAAATVVLALFTLGAAALCAAGLFAPASAAAAGLGAAQIDAFLAAHDSPMTGAGATFVAEGRAHGVDPAFLVAITGAETSFGRFLYSQGGDQCTFNAFNWFYGPTWPQSDFSSFNEAIARVAEGLAGPMYYGSGLVSVEAIGPRYCPDGTAAWIANVTAFLTQLGGDPADTRLAAESAAMRPGALALEGSIRLTAGRLEVGRSATARFTIVDRAAAPVQLDGVRMVLRGPGSSAVDLASDQPVTLTPGQRLDLVASWPLDTVGAWYGWIDVVQGGQTFQVGEKRAFSFRVALPHRLLARHWVRGEAALSPGL